MIRKCHILGGLRFPSHRRCIDVGRSKENQGKNLFQQDEKGCPLPGHYDNVLAPRVKLHSVDLRLGYPRGPKQPRVLKHAQRRSALHVRLKLPRPHRRAELQRRPDKRGGTRNLRRKSRMSGQDLATRPWRKRSDADGNIFITVTIPLPKRSDVDGHL